MDLNGFQVLDATVTLMNYYRAYLPSVCTSWQATQLRSRILVFTDRNSDSEQPAHCRKSDFLWNKKKFCREIVEAKIKEGEMKLHNRCVHTFSKNI